MPPSHAAMSGRKPCISFGGDDPVLRYIRRRTVPLYKLPDEQRAASIERAGASLSSSRIRRSREAGTYGQRPIRINRYDCICPRPGGKLAPPGSPNDAPTSARLGKQSRCTVPGRKAAIGPKNGRRKCRYIGVCNFHFYFSIHRPLRPDITPPLTVAHTNENDAGPTGTTEAIRFGNAHRGPGIHRSTSVLTITYGFRIPRFPVHVTLPSF